MTASEASSENLTGTWQILADPENRGMAERWFERAPSKGWRDIEVPSAWQTVFGTRDEEDPGVAWYRRRIVVHDVRPPVRRFLRFESVATDAKVFLAGRELGRHSGDWEIFEVELPEDIPVGTSLELLVCVDKMKPSLPVWVDGAPVQSGHITKGFHDVLSLQHGGIWGSVSQRTAGPMAIRARGVQVFPDAATGEVRVRVELLPHSSVGEVSVTVIAEDSAGSGEACGTAPVAPGEPAVEVKLKCEHQLWSPDSPQLYRCDARLSAGGRLSDGATVRFGFRSVTTGGPGNERILLNGKPIQIRGVLDWGHEPHHIAPAPTREEIRERFDRLRQMGFNAVCVCMWYPPDHYYDIADETGMLVWQEHPVWKTPMGDELVEEYKAHFEHFFRRDVNHPSIFLVSGACEHERLNPALAAWWWTRAKEFMPDRLLQVQTAFFTWSDLQRTDLYDEHTYDSSGRWTHYLQDLQHALAALPSRKPFVMGESILYNDWPDVRALLAVSPRPWWYPKGLDDFAAAEREIQEKWGSDTLARFNRQARRFNLRGRKFQWERFRQYPNHAGLVSNHLNDVWSCRCGYIDDRGRWRWEPGETRPWLCDAPFLLRTPDGRSGFTSGYTVRAEIGMSNFGARDFDREVELRIRQGNAKSVVRTRLACPLGEVRFVPFEIRLSPVETPTSVVVETVVDGFQNNAWQLWSLPESGSMRAGVYRVGGVASEAAAHELDFEERKYSSGWGLPNASWKRRSFDPAHLIPAAPVWHDGDPRPADLRIVVAHVLTPGVLDYLEGGGRVLHLACKGGRSLPTDFFCLWGQVPLVLEHGPLVPTESEWVCDLLDLDLTRLVTRAVPSDKLGIASSVEPIIRFMYVHDMTDRVKRMDALFSARVGEGLLVVSTLDHGEEAGQYLLARLIDWLLSDEAVSAAQLSCAQLERTFL